jgi:3-methyladenine DNA glycosylase AlkC
MTAVVTPRKGAKRRDEIPPAALEALNTGVIASVNLVEALAIDYSVLLLSVAPRITPQQATPLSNSATKPLGITQRMALAGELLLATYGATAVIDQFQTHHSDTVRGWACYALGAQDTLTLARKLEAIKPLANDEHFGVREWAWLALRPAIAEAVEPALALLAPWAQASTPNYRRFASEATRPRGVWCRHITLLKNQPELALPLLTPLKSDASRYVQDSVGNWLNDAAKTNPSWVKTLCKQWLSESPSGETACICKRALRSIQ